MIPRRLFDLTRRPFSTFQRFFYGDSPISYQRPPLQSSQEECSREDSDHQREERKHRNNNSNDENRYNNRYMGFGAILPLFVVMTNKLSTVSCFFGGSRLERDRLADRASSVQYPANNPIEDRWAIAQLETIPGFVTMVFDGHAGAQVAEFAKENMPKELERALQENKEKSFANEEEYIKASILEAFDRIEEQHVKNAREAFSNGDTRAGRVGACALVTLVTGNKVYVANAGDCQAVICNNQQGKITIKRLNSKLNANSKKEQKRLRAEFPDEDIIYCIPGEEKACYVKKRLQPTRAFGDLILKHAEFNNTLSSGANPVGKVLNYKGPYITHVPVIKVFDLDKNDKYMILSTDGMWDELSKDDVGQLTEKHLNDKQKLTNELLNNALKVAANRKKMTDEQFRGLPLGERRDYHDDMTILVVDLQSQTR